MFFMNAIDAGNRLLKIADRHKWLYLRGHIQKLLDWVNIEIYVNLWYYSLRSNTKGYGGKTH